MRDRRKVAVSIRMSGNDVHKVKNLAARLAVRESEVIRFAVRMLLERVGPLCDREVAGRSLVPVFVEQGTELLRFFDIDAVRLDAIINDGAEPGQKVERADIELLSLAGSQAPYAALRLSELHRDPLANGPGAAGVSTPLRQYLYEKYLGASQ